MGRPGKKKLLQRLTSYGRTIGMRLKNALGALWAFLTASWFHFLGTAGLIGGAVTFADFIVDQYDRTTPSIHIQESDSASPPSLPFKVENRSRYFDMHRLVLNCAGQISFRQDPLIITIGQPSFDELQSDGKVKNLINQITIRNTSKTEVKNPTIKFGLLFGPSGGAHSGNFHLPDLATRPYELKSGGDPVPFACDKLLKAIALENPIVSAKIKVRASYTTNTPVHNFTRTFDTPVISCDWKSSKFRCEEGDPIVPDL